MCPEYIYDFNHRGMRAQEALNTQNWYSSSILVCLFLGVKTQVKNIVCELQKASRQIFKMWSSNIWSRMSSCAWIFWHFFCITDGCANVVSVFWSQGRAYRQCDASGSWEQVPSINRTWANYSECTTYLTSNHRSQDEVCTCVCLPCIQTCACVYGFIAYTICLVTDVYRRIMHCCLAAVFSFPMLTWCPK